MVAWSVSHSNVFIIFSYLLDFALQIQHPSVDLNIFGLVKVFIVKDIWISGESLENESTSDIA